MSASAKTDPRPVALRPRLGPLLGGLVLCAAGSSVLAATGSVVDDGGKPIAGAEVCYFVEIELLCGETDENGRFELPSSGVDTLRARADGYNPVHFNATTQVEPVVLLAAPKLEVRFVSDDDGEPIAGGELRIVYSSGKEVGPFPVNRAGVVIQRGLAAGEVRLIGSAEGFAASKPHAVKLEAGKEHAVTLRLQIDRELTSPGS